MATYVNDLRLKEIATGDEAGTWGTSTNTNLELIAEAFSYGTEAITTNADTHTTTIADGSTDPGRSLYLKYTGTLDSACTITLGPNTVSKMWFIENATTGSQNIIISQGSGANVTIPAGETKVVYSDGAGAGAAITDAFASLKVSDAAQTNITSVGALDGGSITSGFGSIDVGSSAITTTGTVTGNTLAGTLSTAAQPNITSLGTLTTLTVDDITINGSTISDSGALTITSGDDFTVDSAADIVLDANGADIKLKDNAVEFGRLSNTATTFQIFSPISDLDIAFVGSDGGSTVTALTLDMSNAGAATFNSSVDAGAINASGTIKQETTVGGFITLKRNDTTLTDNADVGAINFETTDTDDAGVAATILGSGDGTAGGMKLRFYSGTASSKVERQTIYSNGNVVFNETSADADFRVESNGNENMLFVDGGNDAVGIGTGSTTSGSSLDIRGGNLILGGFNSGNDYGIILTPDDSSSYWHIYNGSGSDLIFGHDLSIGTDEKMRLDSNGRLGIGGSPSYLLDVAGAAQFNNIVPTYQSSNGTSSSSNVWKLGTITLGNSTGAVITVLGTQSYSAGSQVAGKTEIVLRGQNAVTTLEGYFYGNTLGANTVTNVYWKNTGTNNEFDIWIKYGANYAGLDHYVETAGTWVSDVSDTGSTSAPAGSTGLPSQFVVTTGGSPRIRVDNDGLKFGSDTAAANALDDYEEGNWTPVFNNFTATGTTSNTGLYVKVGRLVYVELNLSLSSPSYTGGGSGTYITGLPFSPSGQLVVSVGASTLFNTATYLDNNGGGSNLFFKTNRNTISGIGSVSFMNSSGYLRFSATYYSTA